MKMLRVSLVLLLGVLFSSALQADHRHRTRWSISIGAPMLWQFGPHYRYSPYPYYGYPYGYPQPVLVVPSVPAPVYVEQPPPRATVDGRLPAGYWYYCQAARAYYPYVRECPEAWQAVPPTPAE